MSIDTVDLLHAAEDEVGRLRSIVDEVWEVLQMPFEWSADTPEAVAQVLRRHGWKQAPEEVIFPIEEEYGGGLLSHATTAEQFERIRRAFTPEDYCRGCEDPEECDDEYCGCPCHDRAAVS